MMPEICPTHPPLTGNSSEFESLTSCVDEEQQIQQTQEIKMLLFIQIFQKTLIPDT